MQVESIKVRKIITSKERLNKKRSKYWNIAIAGVRYHTVRIGRYPYRMP